MQHLVTYDRVEKTFAIRGTEVAFDLDIFNLGNRATVLGRQYDVTATGSTGFDQVLEIMNPRLIQACTPGASWPVRCTYSMYEPGYA